MLPFPFVQLALHFMVCGRRALQVSVRSAELTTGIKKEWAGGRVEGKESEREKEIT